MDIHTEAASKMFAVPVESVTTEMRRMAKVALFAKTYGHQPTDVDRDHIEMVRREAQKMLEEFRS